MLRKARSKPIAAACLECARICAYIRHAHAPRTQARPRKHARTEVQSLGTHSCQSVCRPNTASAAAMRSDTQMCSVHQRVLSRTSTSPVPCVMIACTTKQPPRLHAPLNNLHWGRCSNAQEHTHAVPCTRNSTRNASAGRLARAVATTYRQCLRAKTLLLRSGTTRQRQTASPCGRCGRL